MYLKLEEKLSLTIGRDGGLQNLEVHGLISLKVTDDKYGRIKVLTASNDKKGIQLQVGTWLALSYLRLSLFDATLLIIQLRGKWFI